MEKSFEPIALYRKFFNMLIKYFGLIPFICCTIIYGCAGKGPTNNTPEFVPENIIKLDLSIPGSFAATYYYGPSILCNETVLIGSAKLECDFIPPPNFTGGSPILDAIYTTDLAATIADGCIVAGVGSDTKFIGTPLVSGPCTSGSPISCSAIGVNPSRSFTINGTCP